MTPKPIHKPVPRVQPKPIHKPIVVHSKPVPTPPPAAPAIVMVPAIPPPAPVMVDFIGKGELPLAEVRRLAPTYGQFLKTLSPEICPNGELTPSCKADIAAIAMMQHSKDYVANGEENSRTLAIMSADTLYSLAPTDEHFLLMLMLRQNLNMDLPRFQKMVDTKTSTSTVPWGPATYLTTDSVALKASLRNLDGVNVKVAATSWALEKTVAQTLLTSHKEAIHAAIAKAHKDDVLTTYLQSARMEVLIGGRDAALDFLNKAQTILSNRSQLSPEEKMVQVTVWHRLATLMAPSVDRNKLLHDAAKILNDLPKSSPQRVALGIENLALAAQLETQDLRAGLNGQRDQDIILRVRNVTTAAVAAAEKLLNESDAKVRQNVRLAPLMELKTTLAEQQLEIAYAVHAVDKDTSYAADSRFAVESQFNKDVAAYTNTIPPQDMTAFKARHHWAMAQYDFFTGAMQNSLIHLQTIASQFQGTPQEAMMWQSDKWPSMAGIVTGDHKFSPTLNEKSISAGMKTYMQAYLQKRGTAFMGCESGAVLFALGAAAIVKQFSPAMTLAGCFSGNAVVAATSWSEATGLIHQSYVTGLSTVTEAQAREIRNELLMQASIAVVSGGMGFMAQRATIAATAALQRSILATELVMDTPWMTSGVPLAFQEASYVAGGLVMGKLSNSIYGVLDEPQHHMSMLDAIITYSTLGWVGAANPAARIFADKSLIASTARGFTNISLSGWAMGGYQAVVHPSDTPFLQQTADTTAMMGLLHTTFSAARLWSSAGKVSIPQPLDDLAATESTAAVTAQAVAEARAAFRAQRTKSDRLLSVNAVVSNLIDTFIQAVENQTFSRGRPQRINNMEDNIQTARAALAELVRLSDAGMVVDIRQLGLIWKSSGLPQADFRVASIRILEGQARNGHITRISKGLVGYMKDGAEFNLLTVFQVVDPLSWSVTNANIVGLHEALVATPASPLLQYFAGRIVRQVNALPEAEYRQTRQLCKDTLTRTLFRAGYDALNDEQVTPLPTFEMPGSLTNGSAVSSEGVVAASTVEGPPN